MRVQAWFLRFRVQGFNYGGLGRCVGKGEYS